MSAFVFVFWFCAAALFHTYIFYPLLLSILSKSKKSNVEVFKVTEPLPTVSILMAVYNEQEVIAEKIKSIFNTTYPKEKLQVLIGSDNSTDNTNKIIVEHQNFHSQLHLTEFKSRTGKTGIINNLYKSVENGLLIITDANVFFEPETIFELIKNFKNNSVSLVDSNMFNVGMKKDGISIQEKTYIQTEVSIKNAEGKLWGSMMGPFGGCYAVRKNFFSEIPSNFLVDDFYVSMKVLEKGGKCINELNAKVYEDVSNNLKDEFKRKTRIASGNFQNLFSFVHLLFRFNAVSFCFFSHKVLRWLGPIFLLAAYFSNAVLLNHSFFFQYTFVLQTIFYLLPILDFILKKLTIHLSILRFATHLLSMNLALFIGMIKFFAGIKTAVWQPTKRNQ